VKQDNVTQLHSKDARASLRWFSEEELDIARPSEQLRPWLQERGLLTARVQQHCRSSFRLQVLKPDDEGAGWLRRFDDWAPDINGSEVREIVMWCDDVPGLYAETIIPPATAAAQPWLQTLGTQPLGERLQMMQGVTRSSFSFAALPAGPALPSAWLSSASSPLWARRSSFRFASADSGTEQNELWLIEVFLAATAGS